MFDGYDIDRIATALELRDTFYVCAYPLFVFEEELTKSLQVTRKKEAYPRAAGGGQTKTSYRTSDGRGTRAGWHT
eukprot:scaffold4423_cov159-Skeletonema_menzelii.AAC.16